MAAVILRRLFASEFPEFYNVVSINKSEKRPSDTSITCYVAIVPCEFHNRQKRKI